MTSAGRDDRLLRKLERIVSCSLSAASPRTYKALGIDRLEETLGQNADAAGCERDRGRVEGVPVRETTPRVRRGLGL